MERTLDAKGRWRNRTVGFRVSEEEAKMIDRMVALSLPRVSFLSNSIAISHILFGMSFHNTVLPFYRQFKFVRNSA